MKLIRTAYSPKTGNPLSGLLWASSFYIVLTISLLFSGPVFAHKASDSYLSITSQEHQLKGQWDIALRDLDYALGLDDNGDRRITWGELQAHHPQIAAYALSRLGIQADGRDCTLEITDHLVDNHTDGAYAVLQFNVKCPEAVRELAVDYRLLFDLDPSHRGLLRLEQSGQTQTAVFSPKQPTRNFPLAEPSTWREFMDYVQEGVWHIWQGYDHILFLISLLLPAVVWRNQRRWYPVLRFKTAFVEVLKIVTAFTFAHSITLSLAVLGYINLPSRWVESIIAASVLLAALNNIYPIVLRRIWVAAFMFGLIHGLGFANVLIDLGLPKATLAIALLGFNLGVELGQFAIVGLFLPVAFTMRETWLYQRISIGIGSWVIAIIAVFWLVDRSLGLGWAGVID